MFWTQNYVEFSRGGAGIGQNPQLCTQKELNAFCLTWYSIQTESTDTKITGFDIRRSTHLLHLKRSGPLQSEALLLRKC